jgi:hypothetical protein
VNRRYRKRPVVIEAMQFDGSRESAEAIMAWAPRGCVVYHGGQLLPDRPTPQGCYLSIFTPRGVVSAETNDWIIIGSRGTADIPVDVYPCPAAVFAATYEAVP